MIKMKMIISAFIDYLFLHWIMFIPFHAVRLFFIRKSLKKVGQHSTFLMGAQFWQRGNIYVGDNSIINQNVLLDGRGGKLIIGDNVDIARETNIWTLGHDVNDDYHGNKFGDVFIEDYVWIASRVTILPGVTIGRGAVIGTGSVVTKNIPPMAIAAGIPAKIIGERKSKLLYKLHYSPWFK